LTLYLCSFKRGELLKRKFWIHSLGLNKKKVVKWIKGCTRLKWKYSCQVW
jgi:hypothetical protein